MLHAIRTKMGRKQTKTSDPTQNKKRLGAVFFKRNTHIIG